MKLPFILSLIINYKIIEYSIKYPKILIQKLDKFMISKNCLYILILIRLYNVDYIITYILLLLVIAKNYYILCLLSFIRNSTKYYICMFYVYFITYLLTIIF